jgi:hypothetical protein
MEFYNLSWRVAEIRLIVLLITVSGDAGQKLDFYFLHSNSKQKEFGASLSTGSDSRD